MTAGSGGSNDQQSGGGSESSSNPAKLTGLTIGSLTLTPTFDADVTEYAAATENATNKVTATAAEGATIGIKLGETDIENESSPTWSAGENTLTITVSETGKTDTVYTVTVTKS